MGPFSLVGVAISFPRRMVVDKVNYCVLLLCNVSKPRLFCTGGGLTVLLYGQKYFTWLSSCMNGCKNYYHATGLRVVYSL